VTQASRASENYSDSSNRNSLKNKSNYNKNGRMFASEQNLTTAAGLDNHNDVVCSSSSSRGSQFNIMTLGDLFRLILKNRPKLRIQFKLNEFTLVLHVLMKKSVTIANNQYSPIKSDVQNLMTLSRSNSTCSSVSSPLSSGYFSPSSSRSISRSTSLDSMLSSSLSSSFESISDRSNSLESLNEMSPTSINYKNNSYYQNNSNNYLSKRKLALAHNNGSSSNHHLATMNSSPSYTTISVSIEIEIYLNSKGITTSNQQVSKCLA